MSDNEAQAALQIEAEWLERAHANSVDKGYSPEYRRGFAAAAGWVRFHAEYGQFDRVEDQSLDTPGGT